MVEFHIGGTEENTQEELYETLVLELDYAGAVKVGGFIVLEVLEGGYIIFQANKSWRHINIFEEFEGVVGFLFDRGLRTEHVQMLNTDTIEIMIHADIL